MHRTFGKVQWQQLRNTLMKWKQNLAHVQGTIQAAIHSQYEPHAMTQMQT